MKIAILGGSFDPPHIGHLLVAQQVKKRLNIDQVWLMPTYSHPFQKSLIPVKHRLAMTKFLEDDNTKASDFEITKKGISFTIDTVHTLSQVYPQHSFYWISGSDQIQDFPKWKNWQEFLQTQKIILYARDVEKELLEHELLSITGWENIPNNVFVLATKDLPTMNISSNTIQERMKQKQSIRGLVTQKVEEYILEHKLYILDPHQVQDDKEN